MTADGDGQAVKVPSLPVPAVGEAGRKLYEELVDDPARAWTVACMADWVPDLSVNRVRTILHALLGDGLMDIDANAHRPVLNLRLNPSGARALTDALRKGAAK